jgi:hypothetical protein
VTSRPILFSAPMVKALLAGTKTQTRRIVKPQPINRVDYFAAAPGGNIHVGFEEQPIAPPKGRESWRGLCPYGRAGDRLWVKETWAVAAKHNTTKPTDLPERSMTIAYRAGGHSCNDEAGWKSFNEDASGLHIGQWRPSLFMRRWMSRLTLEITAVRVERLQEISEADAVAEGCDPSHGLLGSDRLSGYEGRLGFDVVNGKAVMRKEPSRPIQRYRWLWESVNGAGSWEANPFVWVVSFRRVEA